MGDEKQIEQSPRELIDRIADEFEKAWCSGLAPRVEDYLSRVDEAVRPDLLKELLAVEVGLWKDDGVPATLRDYGSRFLDQPPLRKVVEQFLADRSKSEVDSSKVATPPWPDPDSNRNEPPEYIARYRVERLLGEGGFGRVYLAYDAELDRPVAVKVPRPSLQLGPNDAEQYRKEARTVARLEHPSIVPVYDSGSTDVFPIYIVSKYVKGSDLASRLKRNRLSHTKSAELVATVAEALQYAHQQGLVHRDIKPGNILLDDSLKPFVVDFGLALREQDLEKGPKAAGTPAYMSPEQARGEGHRVDPRSDVFSLSVVFYELLVGRRPFRAETQLGILEQITTSEPWPPRGYDRNIPKELERICLKGLSKRATDRYTTAQDLADELREFLLTTTDSDASENPSSVTPDLPAEALPSHAPISDSRPIRIVPKGLRSFDEHDADFFLELLPGPRDRDGLPDSLRFWKFFVEKAEPANTFPVGLIYGPSGCGKSSLIRAGLLPRLSEDVLPLYVESTAEETENRILNGLRHKLPSLSESDTLKDTLAAIRRGQGRPSGKVLIVLDQFEQWLHANRADTNTELVQALRQCDGARLQCIVMVRADFWMAATRLMRELEIQLREGHNSASVDLFDLDHSRRILTAFGRAFGKSSEERPDEAAREFVKRAVAGLAENGQVNCARLALFAEMTKGASWTPTSLKEIGGTAGVGATFLERTFSASSAPPEHRYHEAAARAVLAALLPEPGAEIKGNRRSSKELLRESGYARRPEEFNKLIEILDGELRLITPTDPIRPRSDEEVTETEPEKHYQLTHDYLVGSLRDWLTSKQRETRRGRAELLLDERSKLWNAKSKNRYLPTLLECGRLFLFTRAKQWNPPQRKMMRKAVGYYSIRAAAWVALVAFAMAGGFAAYGRSQASKIAGALEAATPNKVPTVVQQLARFRYWADPELRRSLEVAHPGSSHERNVRLALLPVDPKQAPHLFRRLLTGDPEEFLILRNSLRRHAGARLDDLCEEAVEALGASVKSDTESGDEEETDKEQAAKQQSRITVALLAMDRGEKVWPILKRISDPHLRSYFVHWVERLNLDPATVMTQLDREDDPGIRRMLYLCLGELADSLSDAETGAVAEELFKVYRNDPNAGVHAAVEWALRQLGQEEVLRKTRVDLANNSDAVDRQWFVNGQGQTFVVLQGPAEFQMGSPRGEDDRDKSEALHHRRIEQSFAIMTHEVTVRQFMVHGRELSPTTNYDDKVSPSLDCPMNAISWYEAAAYCNWLSEREGIERDEWCFEPNRSRQYGQGMRPASNYVRRLGYRLPTEAEWEYACRAGVATSRPYGSSDELLSNYAVYIGNSRGRTLPVGSLKPNGWGFFDMLGNVTEWCLDESTPYPAGDHVAIDRPKIRSVQDTKLRIARGAASNHLAGYMRSAKRLRIPPLNRGRYSGCRVVRTLRRPVERADAVAEK